MHFHIFCLQNIKYVNSSFIDLWFTQPFFYFVRYSRIVKLFSILTLIFFLWLIFSDPLFTLVSSFHFLVSISWLLLNCHPLLSFSNSFVTLSSLSLTQSFFYLSLFNSSVTFYSLSLIHSSLSRLFLYLNCQSFVSSFHLCPTCLSRHFFKLTCHSVLYSSTTQTMVTTPLILSYFYSQSHSSISLLLCWLTYHSLANYSLRL